MANRQTISLDDDDLDALDAVKNDSARINNNRTHTVAELAQLAHDASEATGTDDPLAAIEEAVEVAREADATNSPPTDDEYHPFYPHAGTLTEEEVKETVAEFPISPVAPSDVSRESVPHQTADKARLLVALVRFRHGDALLKGELQNARNLGVLGADDVDADDEEEAAEKLSQTALEREARMWLGGTSETVERIVEDAEMLWQESARMVEGEPGPDGVLLGLSEEGVREETEKLAEEIRATGEMTAKHEMRRRMLTGEAGELKRAGEVEGALSGHVVETINEAAAEVEE